jgi:ribokinase
MPKPSIVVIGSSNTDMVIKTGHLPKPGETVIGGDFFMNAGGKGANQAVAAARLGGAVTLFAKIGNDIFGEEAKTVFKKEGIDTSFVFTDEIHPSGIALITVDKHGENCITVASGANNFLLPEDLEPYRTIIEQASIILMQLETPLITVEYVAALASAASIPFVLNPAPGCPLDDRLLKKITIITPNQGEAEILTGIPVVDEMSAGEAATALCKKGIQTAIITLGENGALVLHKDRFTKVSAPHVQPVDTTGAGDVFNGALVVALSESYSMEEAVGFACKAASISVTRFGAQKAAPRREEL